jgi:hypothetical protein
MGKDEKMLSGKTCFCCSQAARLLSDGSNVFTVCCEMFVQE